MQGRHAVNLLRENCFTMHMLIHTKFTPHQVVISNYIYLFFFYDYDQTAPLNTILHLTAIFNFENASEKPLNSEVTLTG